MPRCSRRRTESGPAPPVRLSSDLPSGMRVRRGRTAAASVEGRVVRPTSVEAGGGRLRTHLAEPGGAYRTALPTDRERRCRSTARTRGKLYMSAPDEQRSTLRRTRPQSGQPLPVFAAPEPAFAPERRSIRFAIVPARALL